MVEPGTEYPSWMAFMYVMPVFTNGVQGYFRGMGLRSEEDIADGFSAPPIENTSFFLSA